MIGIKEQQAVMEAFKIFTRLSQSGQMPKAEAVAYLEDDEVRGLLSEFVEEVSCAILTAGEKLYMVPLNQNSFFHMSNQEIKERYLPARALNMDIYLMYVAMMIFIGEFYDSYQSSEPTRDFLTVTDWLESVTNRLSAMKALDEEKLIELEKEYEYNWLGILKRWEDLDIINESVKKQTAKSGSKISFLNIVKNFMVAQDLAVEVGFDEIALTQKAKVIVGRYFMDYEYNRGVLELLFMDPEDMQGDNHNADN